MQFKIFYGVSLKYEDNKWLHRELAKYGKVSVVDVADFWYTIGNYKMRSVVGQIIHAFICWCQGIKLLINTNKDDIVVTRSHGVGVIFMVLVNLFNLNRKMVSYNWIDIPKKRYFMLAKIALRKNNFIPVVNDKRLLDYIKSELELSELQGLYLPDTYDVDDKFLEPKVKLDRYIFAGGINNRDWDTLLQVAEINAGMRFCIVANRYLWKERKVPQNVKLYFDLSIKEYNLLLERAYVCIVPLKEDRVSGLINIIKAHQYGIPTITTDLECSNIYYPQEVRRECLYLSGDVNTLNKKLKIMMSMPEVDYIKLGLCLQQHLKKEFSATVLVEKLISYLIKVKWVRG